MNDCNTDVTNLTVARTHTSARLILRRTMNPLRSFLRNLGGGAIRPSASGSSTKCVLGGAQRRGVRSDAASNSGFTKVSLCSYTNCSCIEQQMSPIRATIHSCRFLPPSCWLLLDLCSTGRPTSSGLTCPNQTSQSEGHTKSIDCTDYVLTIQLTSVNCMHVYT